MGLRLCCFCPHKSLRRLGSKKSIEHATDKRDTERRNTKDQDEKFQNYCYSSFPQDYGYNSTHSSSPVKVPDPLTLYNWYYGTITRFQAQEMLKNEEDGVFLVRKSSESKTEFPYIISVKQTNPEIDGKENYHYRIRKDENGYFTLGSNLYFKTVMDLIEFYKGRTDILKVTLKHYIDHTQTFSYQKNEPKLLRRISQIQGIFN